MNKNRLPPHNLEAEVAVLASLLLEPNCWDQVSDVLHEEDFYKPAHKKIFLAIKELQKKNLPTDLVVVSNHLKSKGELDIIGPDYLLDLFQQFPMATNIKSYSQIVREKSVLRKVIQTNSEIIDQAYDSSFEDLETFLDSVESKIFAIAEQRETRGLVPASEIVPTSIERIEFLSTVKSAVTGVPSGFTDLDKMTSGFQPGELIIIAARPSMGKTAFCLNIMMNAALKKQRKVALFSLEMGREQLMIRMLASEAAISISDIRVGALNQTSWGRLIESAARLNDSPISIDDTSGISPFEIRAKCRRLKAQHGLDMIVIDYLQLMDLKQKVESRERAVSEISKTLKSIAKELQLPVIALAQLNRGVENRGDRRPMLSDLRESGSIEQDADVIMMIYRDEYYEKDNSDQKGVAEIIVAKQRNGPTGTVRLSWRSQFGLFSDLAPESMAPPPSERPPGPPNNREIKNFAPQR